jgi:hypothetical protein
MFIQWVYQGFFDDKDTKDEWIYSMFALPPHPLYRHIGLQPHERHVQKADSID